MNSGHGHDAACSLLRLGLLLVMAVGAAPTHAAFADYHPAAVYAERSSTTFYLPMRDGVRLAVRVTRPARDGVPVEARFPVVWTGTLNVTESAPPHDRARESDYRDIPSLTDYGYVVVQVARRGNGQSFGMRRGYNDRTEAYDAYEITEWLARQSWSTGAIGVYGCSNTGDAAMHTMSTVPPHLKAVFAGCFTWHKWDAFHRGGIYAQWGVGPQRTLDQDLAIEPVAEDENRTLLRQAAEEHRQSTNLPDLWHGMPFRDSWSALVASRFWYEGSVSSYADQLRRSGVALYIQGGWHDELRDQGLITWLNIPHSRILIGPWKHCMSPDFQMLQEIHRFFDTYLKGIHTGLDSEPRIHYYTMNAPAGAQWRTSDRWPLSTLKVQRLFLASDGSLTATAPQPAGERSFVVNTQITCPDPNAGPFDQPCHVAGEGTSFTGPPLAQDLEVTGNPVITLRMKADRSDASVFVYLEDVTPDGSVTEVTEGRLKASLRALSQAPWQVPNTPWHRGWNEDARPLTSGEATTLQFDLMPTSYVFHAGHRLQLTVSGADFRESLRDPLANGTRISVLSDSAAPSSSFELPTVVASARRAY